MDTDNKINELLNVDLDAIAAKDKKKKKKTRRIVILCVTVLVLAIVGVVVRQRVANEAALNKRYSDAKALFDDEKYQEAIVAFKELGDYKDSADQSKIAWDEILKKWDEIILQDTISAGYSHTIGLKKDGTVLAIGDNRCGQCDVSDWSNIMIP